MSELNIDNKYNFFGRINKDKYGFFKIWEKPETPENDTIIQMSLKNQSKIKNMTDDLIDDFRIAKNNLSKERKKEEINKEKSKLNKNKNKKVSKILKNIDKMFSKIKNSQEKLSEINMNSLLNMKKEIKKSEKIEESNSLVKKKEKEYKKLENFNKKKKSHHYQFLSDYYRRQLNQVLLGFHPIKHLEKIKSLRKENPEINEEFKEKTKVIEKELFQKTSPNFHFKNQRNFKKTFYENNKNTKDNLFINTKTNINFYQKEKKTKELKNKISSPLPKIANFTSFGFHPVYKCYATEAEIPKRIISQNKLNLYNFNQNLLMRKNKMRKFPDKEGRKLELQLMEDACKNIINSIDKVEGEQNDFYNKYAKLNADERKKIKDDILEDKTKTENILLKIKNNNLMKGIKDDMNIKRKKVNDDIKNYGKQINHIRDQIIQNIEEQESFEHEFII